MAEDVSGPRVRDFPPEEEWPDLEEELYAESDFPMGERYGPAYEFLHGARITLDAGLVRPTRLLAAAAAQNALLLAEQHGEAADGKERAALEAIGRGEVGREPEELLGALTELAVFVEGRVTRDDA